MTILNPIPDNCKNTDLIVERKLTLPALATSIGRAIRASYDPRPLSPPQVDRNLQDLPVIPRIAEVLRYSITKLEYSLSSGGDLRAWLKLNLLIALIVTIPAVLVLPPITLALDTFATWSAFVATTAINLCWATVAIVGAAAVVTLFLFVLRRMLRIGRRS